MKNAYKTAPLSLSHTTSIIMDIFGCLLSYVPADVQRIIALHALTSSFEADPPECTRELFVLSRLCAVTESALRRSGLLDTYMQLWYELRFDYTIRGMMGSKDGFYVVWRHALEAPISPRAESMRDVEFEMLGQFLASPVGQPWSGILEEFPYTNSDGDITHEILVAHGLNNDVAIFGIVYIEGRYMLSTQCGIGHTEAVRVMKAYSKLVHASETLSTAAPSATESERGSYLFDFTFIDALFRGAYKRYPA